MKKSKLVYCEKCGVIKSKKTKCSNCIDIHRLSQGMSRLGERKIEEDKERQRNISKGRIMSNKKKKKKKNKFKGKTFKKRKQKVIDTAYVMISDEVLDQECFNIVNN